MDVRSRIVGHGDEPPDQLLANPLNFRRHPGHQMDALRGSMRTLGWVKTVLVNKQTGYVLDGHARVEEALRQKLKTIPVTYVDLTPEEERLALAVLDPITEIAIRDQDAMSALLADVTTEDRDLQAFLATLGQEPEATILPGTDLDEVPEPPANPVTKLGDLIVLGRHRLLCGDSTNIQHVERLMAGERADAVYTDPPYGIAYSGKGITAVGVGGDFGEILGDRDTDAAREAFACAATLAAPVSVWWGANYYCDSLPPSHAWIVWDKEVVGDVYSAAEMAWTGAQGRTRMFRHQWHGMVKASERGEKRVHPTQKPVELAKWALAEFGAGQVVVDLFGGSGSTLIACEASNRSARVMEMDPQYCDVIVSRWEKATGQKAQRPQTHEDP